MNDPGLDRPISDGVAKFSSHDKEQEEEDAYHMPANWWFASTACPLLAATFGPMANTFSILALATSWRITLNDSLDDNGTPVPDPQWLLAVNGVSLVFAIIANLSLLLNMAGRLRFAIAQPLTIVGFFLASLMLVALDIAVPTSIQDGDVMSQGFYYAVIAGPLYFLIALLMCLTVYGAWCGHYKGDFKLSTSQRTLMLQTIFFLVYLLVVAVIYTRIEGWKYLDSVYWFNVTVLTIGIGDFHPTTHLGRSLLFPFTIFGILIVGILIGSIRSLVLEQGKEKVLHRLIERERESALRGRRQHFWLEFTPLRKFKLAPQETAKSLSQEEKERDDFELMRSIHHSANETRRWTALFYSSMAWFTLWLGGAFIFWKGEEVGQGWTYFDGIYFAFTSLITLGYGDYYIQSESSKPFFVFWSLMAIPTVTVLISNLGETLIQGIESMVLRIGDWTILPDDKTDMRSMVKRRMVKTIKKQRFLPPGLLGFSTREDRERDEAYESEEQEERAEEEDNGQSGTAGEATTTTGQTNEHPDLKIYTIAKEIRKLIKVLRDSPQHQFTFKEWNSLLPLTGQQVPSAIQAANDNTDNPGGQDQGQKHPGWSWLGEKSPLKDMSGETEWLLERLTASLENELRDRCQGTKNKSV